MIFNYISLCCGESFNKIKLICLKINEYFKKSDNSQKYSQISSNNNEENKPAKILSSEEINEMIKNQIKYSKEQSNINEYKMIKQKNSDDSPKTGEMLNLEEIKNEINQIEFEEDEQKKKKKEEENEDSKINIKNENNENGINNKDNIIDDDEEEEDNTNLNIEELRKDVLESNDDE